MEHENFFYFHPDQQEALNKPLSNAIGWNNIQRRNMAFVAAYDDGADIIASCDDDNIPMEGWGRDLMIGRTVKAAKLTSKHPVIDPISSTEHDHLWHRGFPVQLLHDRRTEWVPSVTCAEIQADFWNGDPDIDAICRMQHPGKHEFKPSSFPFFSQKLMPFNSQNTFLKREVMPHYFMFPGVGRSDDIWPSYHAQAQGFGVIFGKPSVVQERNPQDIMRNFEDELNNYRHNLTICQAIADGDKDAVLKHLPYRSRRAFDLYQDHLTK
jgi:hypothetical protein